MSAAVPSPVRWRIVWAYHLDGMGVSEIVASPLGVKERLV